MSFLNWVINRKVLAVTDKIFINAIYFCEKSLKFEIMYYHTNFFERSQFKESFTPGKFSTFTDLHLLFQTIKMSITLIGLLTERFCW
jgi:hypothetical protein